MESSFQFTTPFMEALQYQINTGFKANSTGNIDIGMKLNVFVKKNNDKEKREAKVTLSFELGENDDSVPFYIKVTETADFRWQETDDDRADDLLNQNAPALLLSYIRPIVNQVTNASPFEAFNIPFLNFTKK